MRLLIKTTLLLAQQQKREAGTLRLATHPVRGTHSIT